MNVYLRVLCATLLYAYLAIVCWSISSDLHLTRWTAPEFFALFLFVAWLRAEFKLDTPKGPTNDD